MVHVHKCHLHINTYNTRIAQRVVWKSINNNRSSSEQWVDVRFINIVAFVRCNGQCSLCYKSTVRCFVCRIRVGADATTTRHISGSHRSKTMDHKTSRSLTLFCSGLESTAVIQNVRAKTMQIISDEIVNETTRVSSVRRYNTLYDDRAARELTDKTQWVCAEYTRRSSPILVQFTKINRLSETRFRSVRPRWLLTFWSIVLHACSVS